jgi:hypothetical protein
LETAPGDIIFAEIYFMNTDYPSYDQQPIYGGDQVHGTNVKIQGGASPFLYPKYAGYYSIGDKALCIHFQTKPHFIHRLFTKVLLGWKWYDTN